MKYLFSNKFFRKTGLLSQLLLIIIIGRVFKPSMKCLHVKIVISIVAYSWYYDK